MKLWAQMKHGQRIEREFLYEYDATLPIDAQELFACLFAACEALDLSRPVVLQKHASDMNSFGRCVFRPSDFMEAVSFDRFELEIIREKRDSKPCQE